MKVLKVIEQYLSLVARCNRTVAFELFFSRFHVKSFRKSCILLQLKC